MIDALSFAKTSQTNLNYLTFIFNFGQNFNKFVCVKATLECLGTFTSDANLTNSSIAICSQAALSVCNLSNLFLEINQVFNLPTWGKLKAEHKYRVQFGKLNEPKYVQRLIQIINSCMERFANDSILHSVLDILWSLSGKVNFLKNLYSKKILTNRFIF